MCQYFPKPYELVDLRKLSNVLNNEVVKNNCI